MQHVIAYATLGKFFDLALILGSLFNELCVLFIMWDCMWDLIGSQNSGISIDIYIH